MAQVITERILAVFVVGLLLLSLGTGVAAADSGVSGTAIVESDEQVSEISGVYGTIIIEGTVTGDLSGLAGDITVREGGVVEGDIDAAAGNMQIAGTVGGNVASGAGSVHLSETGEIQGEMDVGAGDVRIDGGVGGDARIVAETIRIGEAATIAGSLIYDGELQGNQDAVAGDITRDQALGAGMLEDLQPFAPWIFTAYAFVFNLLLGAVLIGLFPQFSRGVGERVANAPLRSGVVGLAALIGVPILLALVAVSVVGIPFSLVGILFFLFIIWVGLVYGRFAVGFWLVRRAGSNSLWLGLIVGLLVAAALELVPIVGNFLNLLILLVGLGALFIGLYRQRQRPASPESTGAERSPAD